MHVQTIGRLQLERNKEIQIQIPLLHLTCIIYLSNTIACNKGGQHKLDKKKNYTCETDKTQRRNKPEFFFDKKKTKQTKSNLYCWTTIWSSETKIKILISSATSSRVQCGAVARLLNPHQMSNTNASDPHQARILGGLSHPQCIFVASQIHYKWLHAVVTNRRGHCRKQGLLHSKVSRFRLPFDEQSETAHQCGPEWSRIQGSLIQSDPIDVQCKTPER